MSKVMTMAEAIRRFVKDGDTVVMEGFTHLSRSPPDTKSYVRSGAS
jgi:acyl CoA:acetate/3-ketoacid CoA transferase alpha subunit